MKKTVVVGTANPDKLKELRRLLKGLDVRVVPIRYYGRIPKIVENKKTFEGNAAKKARIYSRLSDHITLADDSGLCVNALKGKPGVYSARFAGPGCTYQDNNRKLLKLLEGKPLFKRQATFNCTVALYQQGRRLKIVTGTCRGRIALKSHGRNGFGFDPVFIPQGSLKTFAQMSSKAKNRVSHRAKALTKTKNFLKHKLET